MRRLLAAACIGLLVLSCGAPEVEHAPSAAPVATASCGPAPVRSASPSFAPSKSHFGVRLEMSDKRLQKLADEVLPTTVAHDKNVKAGAAGRASYEIKRGDIALFAGHDGVKLTTPLQGEIQLCKPLGGVCFGYGRCYPEWEASVVLPKRVTPEHIPRVDFDLTLRQGCVLSPVRFDATSELQKITQQQEREIEQQLNRVVAKHFKQLQQKFGEGLGLGKLPSGECVGIKPESLRLSIDTPLANEQSSHVLVAQVVGTVSQSCEPSQLDPRFDVVVADDVPDDTALIVEQTVALSALEQALAVTEPSARVSVEASGSELLVHVSPFGVCGRVWGRFVPEMVPNGLVLRPVQVSDPALNVWVERRGPLLGADVSRHLTHVTELSGRLTRPIEATTPFAPDWKLEFTPGLKLTHSVRVVTDAVVLVGQLQGTVRAQVQRTPTE